MLIAGVDEAGRGPVLGPMVLSVALIEKKNEEKLMDLGVKDSKLLAPNVREEMEPQIKKIVKEFLTESLQAIELDALMLHNSLNEIEAMKIGKLLNDLKHKPELVIVDSPDTIQENFAKRIHKYLNFKTTIHSEHKADVNHPIVSAASVLAKVERDRQIKALKKIYGEIGSGYAHDEITIAYLRNHLKKSDDLPDIVRKRWDTTRRLLDEKFQKKLF